MAVVFENQTVIVVGSSTTALSCIRLAKQTGASVYGACSKNAWPTKTRYFKELPATPAGIWRGELGDQGHEFLEQLTFESAVLIPATDDAALWLANLPNTARERFLVSSSSAKVLLQIQDKSSFAELAEQQAIPYPYSRTIKSEGDFEKIPFGSTDSIFLKPTNSQAFVTAYNKKALWVGSRQEAIELWSNVNADGMDMIAQEYVRGNADDHYFIDGFRDGEGTICAKMARRRHRIYPIDFGNSSYCESIVFDKVSEAWPGLKRLLEHVGYRGIFSAEFKRDAVSGVFKILEINTRPWVYIEFAGDCGQNMCELYIEDAVLGHAEKILHYEAGRGCVDFYNDLIAVVESPREKRPPALSLIWCWMRSFKLLLAWRDPWPALFFAGQQLRRRFRRVLGGAP